MMIIGIDAGALCGKDKKLRVGVFTLMRNLVVGLAHKQPSDTIRLYTFDAIETEISDEFPGNVEIRVLPRFLFSKVQMSLSFSLNPCDVFMGTGQYVPFGAPYAIGWIYDLGFLEHPEFYPGSANQLTSITKAVVSRSENIITISEYVKNQIVKYYHVDPSRISVCYPGVAISEDKKVRISSQKRPYFLFVGTFKPGKNIPFMIRSFANAVRRGLKSDLLLVGSDRWMSEDLQGIAASENVSDRVQIKGFVDEKILKKLYREAKATLIPSLVEGFGFPVVESFAAGTPVIGSTAGSLPEVIGEAGLCVDPTGEEEFARALLQLEKKEVREQYVKKIRLQLEKFTIKQFIDSVDEVVHVETKIKA